MTYLTPIWAQDGKYPAQQDRLVLGGAFAPGVMALDHAEATQRQQGTNMSIDIAPGIVAVPDAIGGLYLCVQDEVVNLPIPAPPAAGTTRIDRIIARVYDPQASGQAVTLSWQYEVVPGNPASANPTPPAMPAYAYRIAEVTVAAGTSAITNAMIADWRALSVAANQHSIVNSVSSIAYSAIGVGGWWPLGGLDVEMTGPCLVMSHLQHDVSLLSGNSMRTRILVTTRGYTETNPEQQIFSQSAANFITRLTNAQTSMSMLMADGRVHAEAQAIVADGFSSPTIHGGIFMVVVWPVTTYSIRMTGNGNAPGNTNPIQPPWWDLMS